MANPENKQLKKFHGMLGNYGLKNVPEYDTFSNDMQDATKREKLYNILKKKGHEMPSFDDFSTTLGFEKKAEPNASTEGYKPYTLQAAQASADTNSRIGGGNVIMQRNSPLAPEYQQQQASAEQTVSKPADAATQQTDTIAAQQVQQQQQPAQPDANVQPQQTAEQPITTETTDNNKEAYTDPYMAQMAEKTAPIKDMMQQSANSLIMARGEAEAMELRRQDYDRNSKLLEESAAKYEADVKEYEQASADFAARYPKGWQPRTQAEYNAYRDDVAVLEAQGKLIEAKRGVLNEELEKMNKEADALNQYQMNILNNTTIQAQTLKGNVNDLLQSVRDDIKRPENQTWVQRRGFQPKGGIISMGASMSASVGGAGKPDIQNMNRTRLNLAEGILSRTQRIINASEAERKDEETTAIWGNMVPWLGTVTGNVADYMKGYWRGSIDKIKDGAGFDFGFKDLGETTYLRDAIKKNDALDAIAKKQAEGKALTAEEKKMFAEGLSRSERALLDAASMEVAATAMFKTGMGYTGGQVAVEMIPFAIELAINPAAAIGESAGSGVLRYALKKFGKSALKNHKKLLKTGITLSRVGTDVVVGGPTMAMTTGAGKTFADFNRRRTGQIQYGLDESGNVVFAGHEEGMEDGKALATAIASQSLEYSTENLSEWTKVMKGFGAGVKGAGKVADKTIKTFAFMDKTKLGKMILDYRKFGHIGNVFEEYTEEFVNNIGNGIIDYISTGENNFTTEEGGVFNLHDNIETFLSVTVPQVIQNAIGLGAYAVSHRQINTGKYNEQYNAAIKKNVSLFGADRWEAIRSVLDEAEGIEDLSRVALSLVEDMDYTPEQRSAIVDYAQKLVAKRTEDVAEMKLTEHLFETDPDYSEVAKRTNPEDGTITMAQTTDGDVVYVTSSDNERGTSVVYNPTAGETEQIPAERLANVEAPLDANEEAEKVADAKEKAETMEIGTVSDIGGMSFEIVDISPDSNMPIAQITDAGGNIVGVREMTIEEVALFGTEEAENAQLDTRAKLDKGEANGNAALVNEAVAELDNAIANAKSEEELNAIEQQYADRAEELALKDKIDARRQQMQEEQVKVEEEKQKVEENSKKRLADIKALVDSELMASRLDEIDVDNDASLTDTDKQVAKNLIEAKRMELEEANKPEATQQQEQQTEQKQTESTEPAEPAKSEQEEEKQEQKQEDSQPVDDKTSPTEPAVVEKTAPATENVENNTEQKEDLVHKVGAAIVNKWSKAKKLVGNKASMTFQGKKLKGHYVLVEAESLSPSHNPLDGFKKTEGFPEDKNGKTINDRDYQADKNEQTGVTAIATKYTGEALTNMPIVANDSGIPYSGNKRIMAGQIAAQNGTDAEYIESLRDNIENYGFDEEEMAQFTHPRVVFVLDESLPYDAETFALFNKRSEYAQGSTATMIKLGKIISQETFDKLMNYISKYETIGEVWADKNMVNEIISILQNSGLISQAELVQFVENGELTEAGKELISGALVGKVLEGREDAVKAINDPETKSLATSVVTALPQIAANQTLQDNSILGYIADAIILAHDTRKAGVSGSMPITTHLRQQNIGFEEEERKEPEAAVIAIGTFIHSNKTTYLREFLKKYNDYFRLNTENDISLFEDIPQEERAIGMLINAINELSKDIENDKKQTSYTRSMLQSLKSVNASLQNKLNQLKNGTGKQQQQQSRHNRESGGRVESSARDGSEQVAANGSNGSVNDNGGVRGREEENGGRGAERIGSETANRGKEESSREEQQGTDDTTATETASPAASTKEVGGNTSGKTTSSSEGKKKRQSLPKNATRDEAKAYFDSVYGKDSERAKRKLEIWELSNDAYKLKAVYDPEKEAERQIKLMKLCVEDGLDFIKDGFVKFADWAKAMVTDFGEKIKKYLKQTYMSMTAYVDDRTFEQMDSAQTVRGFDLDSIVIDEEEEAEEAEENNNNNNDDNGKEEVLRGSRVPNGTDTNRPSRDADKGGRGVQHGADHGGNGEVEMAGGGARSASQKLDNANGSDGNGRKGTDRDRPSDTGGRNADIESAGNGDEVGRGRDILNGTESPETTDKTDRKEKERTKADLGDKTVPYAPHNKGNANDTVIPAGMANAVYRALDEVAAVHGNDIDAFVAKELGYKDTEELYRHLNGEQIDGVALAIHQLMQGKGFVLGDMGGIGKGRQGAAIIRWAISKGHKPIYFTKGANNFSGVLRDLYDIGSGNLKPFIINEIKRGEVTYGKSPDDTNVRYANNPTEDEYEQFYKTGTIPEGYDFVLLTYSQLNHGDPQSVFETAKDYRSVIEKDKNGKPIFYDDRPVLVSPEADPYFRKANAIRLFAMSNIAVMDESHMAAGKGNTAGFFASILNTDSRSTEGLKGVLFMSATFAKNPEGMGMYARATNIGDANNTSGNLIGAVARGGAIMQEEFSRGLTEGGQYIRRERPMEGDVRNEQGGYTNEESVQRIRENYDKVVAIVNNFAKFQSEYITPMLSLSPVEYAKQNGMVLPDGIKETELVGTVKIAEFQKQLNALKEQLLFAAKAEGVAEVAIEKLKAGERVVISFESTFESPLDDIAKVGEELESTDISRLIERYLSNLFKYDVQVSTPKTRKRKYKKENETEEEKQKQFDFSARGTLSFDDLTDEAQKAYNILLSQLRNADTGLSLSPLDLIIDKITEAGFEVGEYTNRSSKVVTYKEKSGSGMVAKRVAKEKVNKEELQNSFNNGNVRCLLVNKAGSTGIDLHAGKNFKNQEQRCMIYAQFFKDVNDQVQMSYRVDRTNQAQRGAYFTFLSPIPAEQRLAMMYERKLKSLNANTTSDQSTGNEDVGADMLNKYGSKVVREYLLDAPDVLNSLGLEVTDVNNLSDENYVAPQNDSLIKRVLQALAFAPTAVQEEFLMELSERYKMYVTGLNEAGENDLVSTVMKLDAKTVSRKLFTEGKNPGENNPFAENVLIDEVEANVLKKPLTSKEIVKHIERYKKMMTGEVDVENISNEEAVEMFVKRIEGYYETQKDNVKKQRKESEARRANIEKSVRKAAESAEKPLSEEEVNKLIATQVKAAHLDEETLETNESRGLSKIEYRKNLLIDTIRKEGNLFSIGKTVTIPTVLFENGVQQFDDKRFLSTGMFLGFKCGKRNLSESSIYAVYAVADGRRIIELPLSEVNNYGRLKTIIMQSSMPYLEEERNSTTIDNWDSITPSRGREIRHILTGNITQAMIDASSNPALKNGKLITYTDESGNVKHGYLLPVTFDAKAFRPKGSVSERIDDIMNDHQVEISYGGEAVGHIRKAQNRDVRNIEDILSLADRPVVITFPNKALITQEIRKTINTFIVSNDPQYKDYSYKGGEHKFILDGDMDSLSNLLAELSGIGLEADSKLAEWTFDEQGNPIDEKGNPAKQPKRKPVNVAKIARNASGESQQSLADEGILDLSKPMVLDDFRKFFYANNKDEELNRLFDVVYEAASKLGLGLSTFYMNQKGGLVIARFSPFSNSIEINTNPDGWLSMDKDEQSKTILHEMIHSVTSYVLHIVIIKRKCDSRNMRIPWGIRRVFDMLTPEQIDAAERLKNIYENATRNPVWETIADINDKYGLTNENEMVAELSNPVFRGALESIGLWKKVIKNITRLLRFVTPKTHSKEFVKKDAEIKEKAGFTKTNSLTETELNVERLIRSLDIPTYEAYLTAAKMQQAMEDDVRVLDAMLQPKNITIKPGETLSSFNERVKKAFKAGEILRKHHLDAANEMNLLKGTENANTIGLITNFLFDRFEQGGVPMWFETQESAQEAIEENEGAEFSRVTDKEAIKKLESEPTMKVYRAMQLIDGKLYPPMSAIMPDGTMREASELGTWEQADENPELADEKGYFKLDKGNKTSVPARYNPYFHTSLTALNDQFASAQDRPNLVTVEMEIPVSELTSGYKADKAKDSVGKLEWKAGIVQSKLSGTRTVILSRWAKPVRIVPDSEVAASIKKMFGDKNIVMPSNVVTPNLRKELEKLGVSFVKTDNRGKIEDGKWKGMTYGRAFREFSKEASPYRLSDGTVYGWASADGIHLTMEGIRPDTMIHEYGHLWLAAMKENNPALYESLMRLAKDSPLWKDVQNDPAYQNLKTDDAILSEVFARFGGTEGERKMVETMREAIANGEDMKTKASIAGLYSRLAKKLDKAWGWSMRFLNQDPTEFDSMAEAADMLLKDIISGNSPLDGGWKPSGKLKRPKNGNPFFNNVNEYSRGKGTPTPSDIASTLYEKSFTKAQYIEESWFDYLNSVRSLQEAIVEQTGGKIEDFENVYLHMQHLSSINRVEQDKAWSKYVEPMMQAVNDVLEPFVKNLMEGGKSKNEAVEAAMEQFEKYLIAKHGTERNEVLARRDADSKAEQEFSMPLRDAKRRVAKAKKELTKAIDPVQQANARQELLDAETELDEVLDNISNRSDELYASNRLNDYAGLTDTFSNENEKLTLEELEQRAEDYAQSFEEKCEDTAITELWSRINAINGYTLKKAMESGNMSRDTYNRLSKQYKFYVPLRGWNEDTAEDVFEYAGEGMNGFQSANKTAKGRKSRAGDIIATIIAINSSTIMHGNKNLAKQKLLNLAQNKKTKLTSVSNTWYKRYGTGKYDYEPAYPEDGNGNPLTDPDEIADWEAEMEKLREAGDAFMGHEALNLGLIIPNKWQEQQHMVRVNRNGREYVVYINGDPNVAQAINGLLNMDAQQAGEIESAMSKVNRHIAKAYTAYNPLFLLRNLEKDIISATLIGGIKFGTGYSIELQNNIRRIMPVAAMTSRKTYELADMGDRFVRGSLGIFDLIRRYREDRLDAESEVDRYFKEFMDNGGHTGYSDLWTVERAADRVKKAVKRANDLAAVDKARQIAISFSDTIELLNMGFEDITRFATYMTSRQRGYTVLESIADAKDASTNFNKKGSGKMGNRLARTAYIFMNPALQGLMRYVYRLLDKDISGKGRDPRLKKHQTARAMIAFGSFVATGIMTTVLAYTYSLMGGSGDDDDKIFGKKGLGNDYWKVSSFKRRNSILLPGYPFENGYFTINLTPEEALPYSLGAIIAEHSLGYGHPDQLIPEMLGQLSRINPFGSYEPTKWETAGDVTYELMTNFMPSYAVPWWEIMNNKDFMGVPIHGYGNTLRKNSPQWQQDLQNEIYSTEVGRRMGAFANINNIAHVGTSYLGGLVDFPLMMFNTFDGLISGEKVNLNETPAKVFWYSIDNDWSEKSAISNEFRYYKNKVDWIEDGLKLMNKTKNREQDQFVNEHLDDDVDYRYWKVFRKYEKQYNSRKLTDKTKLMKKIIREWRAIDDEE